MNNTNKWKCRCIQQKCYYTGVSNSCHTSNRETKFGFASWMANCGNKPSHASPENKSFGSHQRETKVLSTLSEY